MKRIITLLIVFTIALSLVGCGSSPAATSEKPQAGKWEAEFSFKNKNDVDCHWTIIIFVNEGGKSISDIQAVYYYGELTPKTQVSFFDFPNEITIDKNSFKFSVTEWRGYSSYIYESKATFTSTAEAKGIIDIDGTEHEWTAVPVPE